MILKTFKLVVIACLFGLFISGGMIGQIIFRNKIRYQRFAMAWKRICSRMAIPFLGVKISGSGVQLDRRKAHLIVCNHLSYVDVLILAALAPTAFVTSVEVRETFFLGFIAKLGGCIFVERRDRSQIDGEIDEITNSLKSGVNVIIFPEATSTNGDQVLPFKNSLLASALKAQANVIPLRLQYVSVNKNKFSVKNRDLVCWYGKMDFGAHFFKFLGLRKIVADVAQLQTIEVSQSACRKEIAMRSHRLISESYEAPAII